MTSQIEMTAMCSPSSRSRAEIGSAILRRTDWQSVVFSRRIANPPYKRPAELIRARLLSTWAGTLAALLAVLGLGLTGCGPEEVLGRVEGKVTFQGEPVPEGIIVFDNDQTGVHITADLDADGEFIVDMAKGWGLPPGDYKVSITPPLLNLPIGVMATPDKIPKFPNIPEKYRRSETSGLTLSVTADGKRFDVDMTP